LARVTGSGGVQRPAALAAVVVRTAPAGAELVAVEHAHSGGRHGEGLLRSAWRRQWALDPRGAVVAAAALGREGREREKKRTLPTQPVGGGRPPPRRC